MGNFQLSKKFVLNKVEYFEKWKLTFLGEYERVGSGEYLEILKR